MSAKVQSRTKAVGFTVLLVAAVAAFMMGFWLSAAGRGVHELPLVEPVGDDVSTARQDEFEAFLQTVWDKYPNDYVSARWNGNGGTVTVSTAVAQDVQSIADAAHVSVDVEASDGIGLLESNELASDATEKIKHLIHGSFNTEVDPTTHTVTVTLMGGDPAQASEALRAHLEDALGEGTTVTLRWHAGAVAAG